MFITTSIDRFFNSIEPTIVAAVALLAKNTMSVEMPIRMTVAFGVF